MVLQFSSNRAILQGLV
uniref:Uncharacterized protein n=1 Tax=Nymphaea colorata TaxID=210225 RepID=A0A5K0XEP8_9MAGN